MGYNLTSRIEQSVATIELQHLDLFLYSRMIWSLGVSFTRKLEDLFVVLKSPEVSSGIYVRGVDSACSSYFRD